jgi:hypothetical protein
MDRSRREGTLGGRIDALMSAADPNFHKAVRIDACAVRDVAQSSRVTSIKRTRIVSQITDFATQ